MYSRATAGLGGLRLVVYLTTTRAGLRPQRAPHAARRRQVLCRRLRSAIPLARVADCSSSALGHLDLDCQLRSRTGAVR